ncbi:MAG: hypothetical protein ABDH18_04730 [Aquificaceae bacterium]
MKSWVYYLQLLVRDKDLKAQVLSCVYVVALPEDENLSPVELECYASEYLPHELARKKAMAYALGPEEEIKNPSRFRLKGYRDDLELYIFEEGISFEDGLVEAFRLMLDGVENPSVVEPIMDVGSPPRELLLSCLKRAIKH